MVSSYETVATKIKNYLTENNLGELVKEEDEKKYKDFYNLFAPEILEKLEGKEVRDKIFSHDSDKSTLCYTLESSDAPESRLLQSHRRRLSCRYLGAPDY